MTDKATVRPGGAGMTGKASETFGKDERITSKKQIESLFRGGHSRSITVSPLRMVYTLIGRNDADAKAQVLVIVPKRHLKKAVKRNRVKRQIREAYRKNKGLLDDALAPFRDRTLSIAFIWQTDDLRETNEVNECIRLLLHRVSERVMLSQKHCRGSAASL